jgi:hypothetical protein
MRVAKVEEFEFEAKWSLSLFLSRRHASSTSHIMIAQPAALRLTHSKTDDSRFPPSSGLHLFSCHLDISSLVACRGVALQSPNSDFLASNQRSLEPSGMFLCAHNANQSLYEGV